MSRLYRYRYRALLLGGLGLLLGLLGWLVEPGAFFRAWLVAAVFWLGVPLGALAILCLYRLTGGGWGAFIEPWLRTAVVLLPLCVLLFVPLLFGLEQLYPWLAPASELPTAVQKKLAYLNEPFFLVRAAIYAGLWLLLTLLVLTARGRLLQVVSTLGLLLYVLSVTFFAFDWVMSLDPEWYSTNFGFVFGSGQLVVALAFVIVMRALEPTPDQAALQQLQDLGNLLLAAILLWLYLVFMEYLIIWSADLPHGIQWFVHRQGAWHGLILTVILLHFAVPFLVLLSRKAKQSRLLLGLTALLVLLGHVADSFWLVMPSFAQQSLLQHALALVALVGMGGLFIAAYGWRLRVTDDG